MSLLGKAITGISKKSTGWAELERHFSRISSNGSSSTLRNSRDYLDAVQTVNFVGRCVNTIATDIGAMDWEVYNYSTDEVVSGSKSEQILKNPASRTTAALWITAICQHYLLDGNAFLFPDAYETDMYSMSNNTFTQINIMSPALTDIYDDRNHLIEAHTHSNNPNIGYYRIRPRIGEIYNLYDTELIEHIRMSSPHNPIRGMGIVQQNIPALDQDKFVNIFQNQFFNNGAMTNLVVKPAAEMSPEEFQLWQKLFSEKFTGNRNWGKPIYTIPGGEIQELKMSLKDMEMVEKQKFTREAIAGMFYLPDLIAGLGNSGKYDTAPEQIKIYHSMTLPRFYVPIQSGITRLIKRIDENLSFRFVPKHYIDKEKMIPVVNGAFDRGIITQNEGRELIGLPKKDDLEFERRYMSISYVPVDSVSAAQETEKSITCGCGHHHHKATSTQLNFHRQSAKTKKKIERKIIGYLNDYFSEMEKRVISGLEKGYSNIQSKQYNSDELVEIKAFSSKKLINKEKAQDIDDMFNYRRERDEMKKNARKFFTSAIAISIDATNSLLGQDTDSSFSNAKVALAVEKLSTNYVNQTIDNRRDELRKIVSDSVRDGLSVSEVTGQIQDHFNTFKGKDSWRAVRIARTESFHAYDESSILQYEELGVSYLDVIGCEDPHIVDGQRYGCNSTNVPINEARNVIFHPNHTGTWVASL